MAHQLESRGSGSSGVGDTVCFFENKPKNGRRNRDTGVFSVLSPGIILSIVKGECNAGRFIDTDRDGVRVGDMEWLVRRFVDRDFFPSMLHTVFLIRYRGCNNGRTLTVSVSDACSETWDQRGSPSRGCKRCRATRDGVMGDGDAAAASDSDDG